MIKLPRFLTRLTKRQNRAPAQQDLQTDEVEIEIGFIKMKVTRRLSPDIPYEVTAVIPRVEIRRWEYVCGYLAGVEEMLLNSITIVHAPRHPLAGENLPQAGSPPGESPNSAPKIKLNFTGKNTKKG